MNYEFHVGDYVETVDGTIGVIDGIFTESNSFNWIILHGNDNEGYVFAQRYDSYHILEIKENFKRIGAYDFTKKEKKKIEPLNYNVSIKATLEQLSTLKNKINEIIDAVNLLLDKSAES